MKKTSKIKAQSILTLTRTSKNKNAYLFAALLAVSAQHAVASTQDIVTRNLKAQNTTALNNNEINRTQNLNKGAFLTSAGAVGAILGGPVGFVVAFAGSSIVEDQVSRHQDKKTAILEADKKIIALQETVLEKQTSITELEGLVHERLEFEILFKTGIDEPSNTDIQKLKKLATFLKDNKAFKVQLNGHADHRGTDEYNNVLSMERAKSVATILQDEGIDNKDILNRSFGSSESSSKNTSLENLKNDRRVDIKIVFDDDTEVVMLDKMIF